MDDNDPARPRQHPVFRAQGNRGGSRTPRNSESEPAQGGQDLEEEITVPDVSGQSLEEAARILSGAGFEIAAIKTEASQEEPETIIRTEPSAGASVRSKAPVILTMSGGPTGIPPGIQTASAGASISASASANSNASASASATASASAGYTN